MEDSAYDSSSDEETDEDYDETLEAIDYIEDKEQALLAIHLQHYIAPRKAIEKAPLSREFQMSREHFWKLCEIFGNDELFQNDSNHPQCPVKEKMMTKLKRLGCFGNGASVGMSANFFSDWRRNTLKDRYVKRPNEEEHLEVQAEFEEVVFRGCVGLIDGSLMLLQNCLEKDGSDY
ncbi:uncharacterized protein VP01_4431g1 [Puccinia sorghi]|uniref:Uncharacterized protein n=1 Tax=Puccinia sorghi TaxID=27349 RepID=A0A0L6UQC9_9BASI|nr:uncharacterized protein VP01_4431g1 [Puccinia sorghi]